MTIQRADVIFYNGLHLEGRMIEIFERLARTKPVYAIADDLPRERLQRPPEFEGAYDPHVWFDPSLWAFTADVVAQRLATLDPLHGTQYANNANHYKQQLAEIDSYARAKLDLIPARLGHSPLSGQSWSSRF